MSMTLLVTNADKQKAQIDHLQLKIQLLLLIITDNLYVLSAIPNSLHKIFDLKFRIFTWHRCHTYLDFTKQERTPEKLCNISNILSSKWQIQDLNLSDLTPQLMELLFATTLASEKLSDLFSNQRIIGKLK